MSKNPNGLIVDLGVKAFVPLSQVEHNFITEQDLEKYVGKKLSFFILKLDQSKNNVVLSHRLALEKERESLRQKTLANLKVGQILNGKVVNITDFGAFVDIGGIEGLLHISEITWKEMPKGGCILDDGNAEDFRTGDWRSMKPVWLEEKCKQCMLCWPVCPDTAIPVENGKRKDFDLELVYERHGKKFEKILVSRYGVCNFSAFVRFIVPRDF